MEDSNKHRKHHIKTSPYTTMDIMQGCKYVWDKWGKLNQGLSMLKITIICQCCHWLTCLLINLLTLLCSVLLKQLIIIWLIKTFMFHETRRCTLFIRTVILSILRHCNPVLSFTIHFSKINFNIIFPTICKFPKYKCYVRLNTSTLLSPHFYFI